MVGQMRFSWVITVCLSAFCAALPRASADTFYIPMTDSEPGGFDFIQILTAPDYQFPAMTAFCGPDAQGNPSPAAEQWAQMFPAPWMPPSIANPNFATAAGPADGYEFLAFSVWLDGSRRTSRPIFHYQTYLSGDLVGNWDVYCTGPGELDWSIVAGTWAVTRMYPFWLPGDANHDTFVDAADYVILKRNFGMKTGATWLQGDFDFDFDVDYDDLLALMTNFGKTSAEAAIHGDGYVPEPGTLILLAGMGAAALARRRRHTK